MKRMKKRMLAVLLGGALAFSLLSGFAEVNEIPDAGNEVSEVELQEAVEPQEENEPQEEIEPQEETELQEETQPQEETEVVTEVEAEDAEQPAAEVEGEEVATMDAIEIPALEFEVVCNPQIIRSLEESIVLTAVLQNDAYYNVVLEWQRNLVSKDDAGFETVATGETFSFDAAEEPLSATWRLVARYELLPEYQAFAVEGFEGEQSKEFAFNVVLTECGEVEAVEETEAAEPQTLDEKLVEIVPISESKGDVEPEGADPEEEPVEEEIVTEEAIEDEEAIEGETAEEAVEAQEVAQPTALPKVTISWDARDVMSPEETVTLTATVTQEEFYWFTYQWQYDLGEGFVDVEGATEAQYSFPATAELLNAGWQVIVDYRLKVLPVAEDAVNPAEAPVA